MILRLDGISKCFRRSSGDRVALEGVSAEVERGQLVGVFGPSGAGKTTLLRIAAGILAPDGGTVTYNGRLLYEMPRKERMRLRRGEVACVWADPQLREGFTVLENVMFPLIVDHRDHRVAEWRAREALDACEADQCVTTPLGDLTDGERQRVALARALVSEPRLLLADGPSSRLSPVEQTAIMRLLASTAREAKVAVFVADTNADTLLGADPILYLNEGRLVAPGAEETPDNVYPLRDRPSRVAADA